MSPGEVTPMTGLAGSGAAEDRTARLGEEVVELARALPGDVRRLAVRSGDRAIEVEWAVPPPAATGSRLHAEAAPPAADAAVPSDVPEDGTPVRAPLVGTFYTAPSPGADPFVRVGDAVESGQTLGIVEAMKLMNPIVADEPGEVAEIRVGDAESVEYDQVLMVLRPAGPAR